MHGMTGFRFVHAADLHLDTPFQGIAAPAPAVAEALRDASLQAWENLVDLTLDQQAAFLLLAGDTYDGAERGIRAQLRFARGLERLGRQGVRVFIVDGNHDPQAQGWSAVRVWPSNVTVFGHERVAVAAVDREGRRLADVYGISYERRDVTENLALRFPRAAEAPAEPGVLRVGLLHCNVGANADHLPYSPCSVADLSAAAVDYWALGHVHKRQVLHASQPAAAYPGNLQGRSAKPSETGAKGALVVEVNDGVVGNISFHACDAARFEVLSVDITDCPDLPMLAERLLDASAGLQAEASGRHLVVRAILSGRGPVHAHLRRPDVVGALLDDLRERSAGTEPLLWWESLRDTTRSPLDRAQIRGRGDFSAELLRQSEELAADPQALEATFAGLAAQLPQRRLPASLRQLAPAERLQVLADAESLALDLLSREDEP